MSIIASKTIKPNESKTVEPNTRYKFEQVASKKFDVSKTIEQNTSKIIKSGTAKDLLTCIGNMLAEPRRKTTPLGKSIRTDTVNPMYPNSQPNILHLKQATGPGHNVRNHFPIGSLGRSGKGLTTSLDIKTKRSNKKKKVKVFNY